MTNTCQTCHAPADLYLCWTCINQLQATINGIPDQLTHLRTTLARQDKTHNDGREGTNTQAREPVNLEALQVTIILERTDTNATTYARQPNAAHHYHDIQYWSGKADLLINGPEEEHIDHAANRERARKINKRFNIDDLVDYFANTLKITITKKQVRRWAERGEIPIEGKDHKGHNLYDVVTVLTKYETRNTEMVRT